MAKETRAVRIPFAGWVSIDVAFDGEPDVSHGTAPATEFEVACFEAIEGIGLTLANDDTGTHPSAVQEWDYRFLRKIIAGNTAFVDCMEIEVHE